MGFFSTHAISIAVRIVSRRLDTQETIGWEYAPRLKRFFHLDSDAINTLISHDFENHPDETRRRTHGTSVYLNINFEEYPQCEEWLVAESLVTQIRRDFFILPAPIYVADYTDGYPGRKIVDATGQEVHERQLNLDEAPWNVDGNRRVELAQDLLRYRLPHLKRDDLPPEWTVFDEGIGAGRVSGLIWLSESPSTTAVELLLKRMWVESARDVHPLITAPAQGVFDITPDKSDLDVDVSPLRDHVIRDSHFRTTRKAMQRGLVGLFEDAGKRCVQDIRNAVVSLSDVSDKLDAAKSTLEKSAFVKLLDCNNISFGNLLSDIPQSIALVFEDTEHAKCLTDFAVNFVNRRISPSVGPSELKGALGVMQKRADEEEASEDLAVARGPLRWSPKATRDFLKRVGPYVPVPLALRERRKDGGFNVRQISIPLLAVSALNPASAAKLLVLTKGSVAEFLSTETAVGGVVYPAVLRREDDRQDNFCLVLAIVSAICAGIPEIEFVEHKRELLKEIVNRDDWIPLIECLSSIVNSTEERGSRDRLEVDALGYLGEKAIPLVFGGSGDKHRLVINAYNPLTARGKTPRFRPREASAWPAARRLNLAPSPGIS